MGFAFIVRQESHKSASSLLPGLEELWVSSAWQEMTFTLPPAHECQTIVPLLTGTHEVPLICSLWQAPGVCYGSVSKPASSQGRNLEEKKK